jgi:hypothetical protein
MTSNRLKMGAETNPDASCISNMSQGMDTVQHSGPIKNRALSQTFRESLKKTAVLQHRTPRAVTVLWSSVSTPSSTTVIAQVCNCTVFWASEFSSHSNNSSLWMKCSKKVSKPLKSSWDNSLQRCRYDEKLDIFSLWSYNVTITKQPTKKPTNEQASNQTTNQQT